MLRNRAVLVKLSKDKDAAVEEHHDDRPIEEKTGAILRKFEKVGIKVFAGICVYVLLDTFRQVAVARAEQPYPTDE